MRKNLLLVVVCGLSLLGCEASLDVPTPPAALGAMVVVLPGGTTDTVTIGLVSTSLHSLPDGLPQYRYYQYMTMGSLDWKGATPDAQTLSWMFVGTFCNVGEVDRGYCEATISPASPNSIQSMVFTANDSIQFIADSGWSRTWRMPGDSVEIAFDVDFAEYGPHNPGHTWDDHSVDTVSAHHFHVRGSLTLPNEEVVGW